MSTSYMHITPDYINQGIMVLGLYKFKLNFKKYMIP